MSPVLRPTAFIFLAGAWIAGTGRTRGRGARFLLTTGLWLMLVEMTVVSFGGYFDIRGEMGAGAQVIPGIGAVGRSAFCWSGGTICWTVSPPPSLRHRHASLKVPGWAWWLSYL